MHLKLKAFLLIPLCSFLLACPQGVGVPTGFQGGAADSPEAEESTTDELTDELPSDFGGAEAPINTPRSADTGTTVAAADGLVDSPTTAEMIERPEYYMIRWEPDEELPFENAAELFSRLQQEPTDIPAETAAAASRVFHFTEKVYILVETFLNDIKESVEPGYYMVFQGIPGVETLNVPDPTDPIEWLKRYVLPYDYQFIGEFRKDPPNPTLQYYMNSEDTRRAIIKHMQDNPSFFTPE